MQAHFSTVVTLACCLVLALLLVSVILVVTVRLLRGAGRGAGDRELDSEESSYYCPAPSEHYCPPSTSMDTLASNLSSASTVSTVLPQ